MKRGKFTDTPGGRRHCSTSVLAAIARQERQLFEKPSKKIPCAWEVVHKSIAQLTHGKLHMTESSDRGPQHRQQLERFNRQEVSNNYGQCFPKNNNWTTSSGGHGSWQRVYFKLFVLMPVPFFFFSLFFAHSCVWRWGRKKILLNNVFFSK